MVVLPLRKLNIASTLASSIHVTLAVLNHQNHVMLMASTIVLSSVGDAC